MAATKKALKQAAEKAAKRKPAEPDIISISGRETTDVHNPLGVHAGPSLEELTRNQAAIDAKRKAEGMPKIEFTRDALDKKVEAVGDGKYKEILANAGFDEDFIDSESMADPLAEAVERNRPEGLTSKTDPFNYSFQSDRVNNVIGTRGYKPVKTKNGDVVKVGSLMLARIPKDVVEKRKKKRMAENNERISAIADGFRNEVEEARQKAQELGLAVLAPGEMADIETRAIAAGVRQKPDEIRIA